MKSLSIFAILVLASFVAAQGSSNTTQNSTQPTCGDYIQYFCSSRNDCPQPTQGSTPIINVNGNSIDLRDYNAVSFGRFIANTGDVQGRVACAGNFAAGNGFSIGDQLEAQGTNISSATYPYALICGRNAVWGSGRIYSEGIFVGGRSTGDVFDQTAAADSCPEERENCLENEFTSAKSYYVQVSEYFARQQVNTRFSVQYSTLNIQCNSSSSLYVLNISGSALRDITSYQVSSSCNTSALWLFNVIGRDSIIFRGDFFRQQAISILWNVIGNDRTVNVFTQVRGNILAPQCNFNQPGGVVEGNVIANDMNLVLQVNTPRCLPIGGTGGEGGGAIIPSIPTPPIFPTPNQTEAGQICPFWERECSGFDFTLNTSSISFKNYHVISFGNFIANTGDVEGRLAVRNNVVLGCGYSIGFALNTGGENATDVPEDYSLLVGNNARWCSGALFPDGSGSPFEGERENMFIGGQFTGPSYLQLRKSPNTCSSCLASAFSSARACYTSISNSYANLNVNVNVTSEFSTLNLTCESSSESQYVVSITGEQLSQATSWVLSNCNSSAFFIVNVIGNSSVTFTGGGIPLSPSNVLYNILGCGRIITVVTGVNGAILAPYNILNQTGGVIIGKVVIGDVLFALQVNIQRCPLSLQENTSLPANSSQSNNSTGASTLVTTGSQETQGAGVPVGLTSGGAVNETSGGAVNETAPQEFEQCPVFDLGVTQSGNETSTDEGATNSTDFSSPEVPSRVFDIRDAPNHPNSAGKIELFGLVYLLYLLF